MKEILYRCPIFNGFLKDEVSRMIKGFKITEKNYKKGEFIYFEGDIIKDIGIVKSGSVFIEEQDYWGNRTIISKILPGEMFGEAFAFSKGKKIGFNVLSNDISDIIFISSKDIVSEPKLCLNMIGIISDKNISLTNKISHITKRTTREKLISYLSHQAGISGSNDFYIPYNRQELADFLAVERSAMSNELCKMRDGNILDFKKNHFVLHDIT